MSGPHLSVAGCRGSMAVSGPQYHRFGGNTTCYHAEVEPGHHLLIDAGTGLRNVQHAIAGRTTPQRFTLFITHYHWDHIQGLALFSPLFDPASTFDIWAPALEGRDPQASLFDAICRPWWPVALAEVPSRVTIHTLEAQVPAGPVTVRSAELHHPGGVAAYRLEGRHTVVIATDQENDGGWSDERLVALANGADVLIHDAQYTPQEHHAARAGWGHSDWEGATALARRARVTRLVLTSHEPDRTDDEVESIRAAARTRFPLTDAAHEGMTIPL